MLRRRALWAPSLLSSLFAVAVWAQIEPYDARPDQPGVLIDSVNAERMLHSAIAATGCMVPLDLVAAFETFLVTHGMAELGVEIDRETALSASFAARFGQSMEDHSHGPILVAVADATQRVFRAAMRDGRLQMQHMVYHTDGCAPTGTVFVLQEYTWQ